MEMRRSGGGGGCCTTRYTTTTTPYIPYYTNDVSKMDRIMLRFRPIAPKPATSGPTPTSSTDSTSPKKRKSPNKTNKATTARTKKSRSPSNANVVTLSLLPETPDLTRNNNNNDNRNRNGKEPTWLNFGPSDEDRLTALEVIPSTVTVEQVSATWIDGCITDEERKRRLDEDTCPGFISDGWNRVWWINEEYRKMVVTGDKMDTWRKERLVSVKMEMKEKVENNMYGGFTCRVRVQYGSHSMTVPCDVWRMNSGGFAWRLDVKAALTLAL